MEAELAFAHRYATKAFLKYGLASGGGLEAETLYIESNISLNPKNPDYDETKVGELIHAAVDHAKTIGCRLEFWAVE